MAFRFRYVWNGQAEPLVRKWPTDATNIQRGDLLVLSGGKAAKAAPGATGILGVAQDAPSNGQVTVIVSHDAVFEVPYPGTTKTSLADADLGTAFDINTDAASINLDDTLDGMCQVVDYDNDRKVAYVLVKNRALALQ